MRVVSALGSLLLCCYSFFAPILISGGEPVKLPPCCRRDGKHHCAMMAAAHQAAQSGPVVQAARCAQYPRTFAIPVRGPAAWLTAAPLTVECTAAVHAAPPAAGVPLPTFSPRANQGRAPPSFLA